MAGLLMAASTSAVAGHVELVSSSPTAGANLSTIPAEVTIIFDDELDPDLSHFEVTDAASVEVGSGEVDLTVADRNVMTGPVTITAPGVYTVSYTVGGVDGHVLQGAFSFGYQATAAIPGPTGGEGADTAMAPRGGTSVLLLLGWILLIASGVFAARRTGARSVARAIGGAVAVLIVAAMLIGCVKQATLPDDCGATTVQREATLTGDRLDPEAIHVCKGQELTLKITTERAGEIHLHGYEKEMEVQPGDTATFTFSTTLPGQFPIELHTPNNGPEIEIGILTVNEP